MKNTPASGKFYPLAGFVSKTKCLDEKGFVVL